MKIFKLGFFLLMLSITLIECAGNMPSTQIQNGVSLLSDALRDELRGVANSVVGINTDIKYEIQNYNYVIENGQVVPDPKSPLKYKLHSGDGKNGIMVEKTQKTISGGGLIIDIDRDKSRYTILTSNHLVSPNDTTDVYYMDENNLPTDVLFARYIVKDVNVSVRGRSNWRVQAEVLSNDPINDLAVIEVQTSRLLGTEFPNEFGYNLNLSWGDWVFLFGFPRGIKQMTGGWVSEAPYPGTLAVDAVVRFGFSGGPVFAISKDRTKLVFVGLIKSVPRSNLEFIAPKNSLPMGYQLTQNDFENLIVKNEIMVEYGTAYFVGPKTIKKFFQAYRDQIEGAGIRLRAKFYGN